MTDPFESVLARISARANKGLTQEFLASLRASGKRDTRADLGTPSEVLVRCEPKLTSGLCIHFLSRCIAHIPFRRLSALPHVSYGCTASFRLGRHELGSPKTSARETQDMSNPRMPLKSVAALTCTSRVPKDPANESLAG